MMPAGVSSSRCVLSAPASPLLLLLVLGLPSSRALAQTDTDVSVRQDQVFPSIQVGGKTLHACDALLIELASTKEHIFIVGAQFCWFETRGVSDPVSGWNIGLTYGYGYGVSGRWSPFVWTQVAKPFSDKDRYYMEADIDAGVRIRLRGVAGGNHWALRVSAFEKALIGEDGSEDTWSSGISLMLALGHWYK